MKYAVAPIGQLSAQPAPVFNWTGFYLGTSVGYGWSEYDNAYNGAGGVFNSKSKSVLGGVHFGYQQQWGNLVAGIDAGGLLSFDTDEGFVQCPNPATRCAGWVKEMLTVGPRIGLITGRVMPYLSGGYANARLKHEVSVIATGVTSVQADDREDGWYIGAGIEMPLGKNATLGFDYRHYDFGTFNSTRYTPAGVLVAGDAARVKATADVVSLRLNLMLGR